MPNENPENSPEIENPDINDEEMEMLDQVWQEKSEPSDDSDDSNS